MLKIHHLSHSQSERVVLLCEELGLPYELQHCTRGPVTILSLPGLKALHPLGAAPLNEDGDLLLAESAAIVEYIIVRHRDGRFKLGPEHPDYAALFYWFHFSNGNLQPVIGRLMIVSRAKLPADHPVQVSVLGRLDRLMALVEARLGEAPFACGARVHGGRHHECVLVHHDASLPAGRSRTLLEHPRVPAKHWRAASVSLCNGNGRSGLDSDAGLSLV